MVVAWFQGSSRVAGILPALPNVGVKNILVETLNNVSHQLAYRMEKMSRHCGVFYTVERLHKDFLR